ncbi:MAG TPA: CBS domain-containing protein [Planctomycetota bacterium]
MTGILPTLRVADMGEQAMTDNPRYRALEEAFRKLRGVDAYRFRIKGVDELILQHQSFILEACNTSFQVHLQVGAAEFPSLYNLAQLVSAPVLAAAVNSPLLFGKRLWQETRLALFQQSVDTRKEELPQREFRPRVSFGTDWVRNSVLDIFREDIARFRALLGTEAWEDPFEAIEAGRAPSLDALRLHNGTVYRWNRACYGISDGRAHLRIENRILPAGPTPADEVANAALWFGLLHGLAARIGDPADSFSFDQAKANLLAAAQQGLDSQIVWIDGERHPARELLLEQLLPIAEEGLVGAGFDAGDASHYLGLLRARVASGRTGARWLLDSLAGMDKKSSDGQRMAALVAATLNRQGGDRPGHEWDPAQLEEVSATWKDHYEAVGDYMFRDLFTVHQDELVDLAANVMDWQHLRHVPVEDDDHHLVGLVTHRTLLRFFARHDGAQRAVPVGQIMEKQAITVHPETPALQAIALMRDRKFSCLPVVDADKRLVGMLSEHDFIQIAAQLLEQKLRG